MKAYVDSHSEEDCFREPWCQCIHVCWYFLLGPVDATWHKCIDNAASHFLPHTQCCNQRSPNFVIEALNCSCNSRPDCSLGCFVNLHDV
eukprot:1285774-Amphidinium_carterae.1